MPLLHWLENIDRILFVLVQHDSDSHLLDTVMPIVREPLTWVPLYAFLIYYSIRIGKRGQPLSTGVDGTSSAPSQAWAFIVLSLVTFAITDSVTAQILKPLFARPRPCHDPAMQSYLRGLVDCGGLYSMPSNHAANHFGLATFWYFSIRRMTGRKWSWLWLWAALICYAQVYVGKHYPADILVGAIFGTGTGFGISRLFSYWEHRQGQGPTLRQRKTSYI
jgi:membrane-associated phospholipid phosphatase